MDLFAELNKRYHSHPQEVALETLAQCNAKCSFCPYETLDRIGERMPDELIDRLVDEMSTFDQPFYFSPFKVNEPLLDKRTIPLCEKVNGKTRKAIIRLFSNGAALTDANLDGIARLKRVAHLWISLNATEEIEYERLMGISWSKTTANLDRLHSRRFPHRVVLSCVGLPNEEFKDYCKDRWPMFEPFVISRSAWLGYTHSDQMVVPDSPCSRWWELSIMANGIVSHCCQDGEGKFPIGDVNRQTLREVYSVQRERREKVLKRTEVGGPCDQCTY